MRLPAHTPTLLLAKYKLVAAVFAIIIAAAVSSCRSSEPTGPGTDEVPLVKTTITGTVVDESGKPVEGASVAAYGVSSTTDKYGFFVLQNVSAPKDRCVAIATQPGFFPAATATEPAADGHTQLKLFLMSHGSRQSVSASTGGAINVATPSGNASLTFEPNGIATSSGAAFNGDAQVATRYLDPADASFAYYLSGDQVAMRENGERTNLLAYGVMRVDMHSGSGEQLQPALGKPVQVSYPIPATMQASAPATMPLWYFDASKGMWIEEGAATKQGNAYVGTVTHFSDWACATPRYHAILSGTVTCGGSPVSGLWVRVGQSYALTNDIGLYRKHVPANADVEVVIDADVNYEMFFSDATTIPGMDEMHSATHNIQLTSSCPTTITGRLTDDNSQPIPGRLAYVSPLGDVFVAASYDGSFRMHVPPNTSLPLEGMSWVCANTKVFTVTSGAEGEVKNVGDLQLCGIDEPAVGDIDVSTFDGTVLAALSADGSTIGIMARDPMIVIRNGDNGAFVRNVPIEGVADDRLLPMEFNSDGSRFIIETTPEGTVPVRVIDAESGVVLREFDMFRSVRFMPDGQSVVGVKWELLGGVSELLKLSIETGEVTKAYALDDAIHGEFSIMDVTPDGSRAVILTMTDVIVYDLVNDAIISQAPVGSGGGSGNLSDRSISADASRLAILNWVDGAPMIRVLETASASVLYSFPVVDLSWYGAMVLHPNGEQILLQRRAEAGVQPPPKLVDVVSGAEVTELTTEGTPGIFYHYSFSSDGKRLIGLYRNEDLTRTKLRVWNF